MNTEEQSVARFLELRADDPKLTKAAGSQIIAAELFVSPSVVANYLSKHRDRIRAAERTMKKTSKHSNGRYIDG